jgi:hypothetical protein
VEVIKGIDGDELQRLREGRSHRQAKPQQMGFRDQRK